MVDAVGGQLHPVHAAQFAYIFEAGARGRHIGVGVEPAGHHILAEAAAEPVHAGAAHHQIVAATAVQDVVAGETREGIVRSAAHDVVTVEAADDRGAFEIILGTGLVTSRGIEDLIIDRPLAGPQPILVGAADPHHGMT